jgi:PD-(D/E)XK nuclease superfamily
MFTPYPCLPIPTVFACSHWQAELQQVIQQIQSLQANADVTSTAIVAGNYAYRNQIACQLLEKEIPFIAADALYLQQTPLVAQVTTIVNYISSELYFPGSGSHALFQILQQPIWQIPKTEIIALTARVAAQRYKSNAHGLKQELSNTLQLVQPDLFGAAVPEGLTLVNQHLDCWLQLAHAGATLLELLLQVVEQLGWQLANQLLPKWQLTALHHWLQLVQQTAVGNQPITHEVHDTLQEALYQLPAPASNGQGVYLGYWQQLPLVQNSTHVLLVGTQLLTQANVLEQWQAWWQQAALPTAKWYCYYSAPMPQNSEWQQLTASFGDVPHTPAPLTHLQHAYPHMEQAFLKKFVLSATTFNTFLRCPIQFYYQYVLQVPTVGNTAMYVGVALHKALEKWYVAMLQHPDKTWPSIQFLLTAFENALLQQQANFATHQFAVYLQKGKTVLTQYYQSQMPISNQSVVVERMLQKIYLGGVPVKGKIDKLVFEGASVVIVDYKSGSVAKAMASLQPPTEQQPLGGDYWRQALFYLLLVRSAMPNKEVDTVVFDFLEPNQLQEYYQHTIVANNEQLKEVQQQIVSVWQQIQQKNWRTGCGKMHCQWCHMARVYNW